MNEFIEIDTKAQKAIIRKSTIIYIDFFSDFPIPQYWYVGIKCSENSNPLKLIFETKEEALKEYERLKKLLL